ncbi:hypothetical protein [Devosia sp. MC521]|uniref:hypothetical protein n=1 Tax=Devosia sp. MC521 TaxID=2759954 RepID=UPI0015F7EECC|nr:hypothetical protein [Devosia sp. MC521]MBJ6986061.1 hypothetical protein [Devosia sp. MC521]QMW61431.1 hypothetical protein H4N61_10595 [Devosia sp. MC521]
MVDASEAAQTYVLTIESVRGAIARLEHRFIHQHFAGYLAILRAKRRPGSTAVHMSDIVEFHDRYLRAANAPDEAPYVRPFTQGHGLQQMNRNVAGSYAPSSVRANGTIGKVVAVVGSGRDATYDVRENHAAVALELFLENTKAPAASLAAFLYRDFGFVLDHPVMPRVVTLFRDEFGLRESVPEEKTIFDTLFVDDSSSFDVRELVQLEGLKP